MRGTEIRVSGRRAINTRELRVCVSVCVCVCIRNHTHTHAHSAMNQISDLVLKEQLVHGFLLFS